MLFLKPEALFQQQNYFLWKSHRKRVKSCSIHDPDTPNKNIFLKFTFFFFNICHISANCIVSRLSSLGALGTG